MKNSVLSDVKTHKYHLRYCSSLIWAAKNNRKKETESEKVLWNNLLRKKYLGYKFTRQKPIGRFIADFYCSELLLIIEVDGSSHDNKKERDVLRDEYLIDCGIKTIRFSNQQVLNTINEVKRRLIQEIKIREKICCCLALSRERLG